MLDDVGLVLELAVVVVSTFLATMAAGLEV